MTDATPTAKYITISEESDGQRMDNFLFSRLKGLPKSRIYRAIRGGEVRVNKKRVTAASRVHTGDEVRIPPLRVAAEPEASRLTPKTAFSQQLADAILYEDEDLLIVNKPSGMASHGGSGVHFGVIETMRHLRPKAKFLELVHRLDRDTTGCLMLAKKPSILKELHGMLLEGKVDKMYLAVVAGLWKGGEKRVNARLLKQGLRSGERIVTVHPEGKASETIFRPLKVLSHGTLVEAKPLTGRTHQIRVHAAYVGHPILGDEKYGNRDKAAFSAKHLLLHSASLSFELESKGKVVAVCACLDEEFGRVISSRDYPKLISRFRSEKA